MLTCIAILAMIGVVSYDRQSTAREVAAIKARLESEQFKALEADCKSGLLLWDSGVESEWRKKYGSHVDTMVALCRFVVGPSNSTP